MNILVIRFSALGDLVTLEPTFRAFRHFFPEAHITFLTSAIGKGLYEDTPYFNTFIVHRTFLNTLQKGRIRNYDLIFNLQCNKPSHYLSMFMNSYATINKSFNLWQKIIGIKTHSKSAEEMLTLAGCDKQELKAYFAKPHNTIIQFPTAKNPSIQKHIALSTGSSPRWQSKQWGIHNYKQLISHLLEHNFTITLVGSASEEADAILLSDTFASIHNYVNKTSLSELKMLLANVNLYIGNDSGPTHIAASVGTDTLTIFGPTDIKHSPKFEKYKGNHLYIKPTDIACHPCYKGKCPTHHECMRSISVQDVLMHILNHFKDEK